MNRASLIALSLSLGIVSASAHATTWNVVQGAIDPDTRTYPSLTYVPWWLVQPGDDVAVRGGTPYPDLQQILARGVAGAPIAIHAAAGYPRPVINNTVDFHSAAYVVLDGFEIAYPPLTYAAIVIQEEAGAPAAEAITIQNSEIHHGGVGISINSGGSHRIWKNSVHDNGDPNGDPNKIAVGGFGIITGGSVNATRGREILIQGNAVYDNQSDGIAVMSNWNQVIANTVYENGQHGGPGYNGIHLYSATSTSGTGQNNIVSGNIVYATKSQQYDGGGILLDQWCDNNWVYFNVAYQNDGAGIHLFSAGNNVVFNNTLFDNARDNTPPAGSTLTYRPFRAELSIADNAQHSVNDVFGNNLIVPNDANVLAVYVDSYSSTTAAANQFSDNLLYHLNGSGSLYSWNWTTGATIDGWNELKKGIAPDVSYDPLFTNVSSLPLGLVPRAGSPVGGAGLTAVPALPATDPAGQAVSATNLPIGAYLPAHRGKSRRNS